MSQDDLLTRMARSMARSIEVGGALTNKLGITDPKELEIAEYKISDL